MDDAIKKLEKVNQRTFFNTVGEKGKIIDEHKLSADSQTKIILEIFRTMDQPLAAHQVHAMMPDSYLVPITSPRRSIACLTPCYLHKTEVRIMGPKGRMVRTWELNETES